MSASVTRNFWRNPSRTVALLSLSGSLVLAGSTIGCSTKNYVRAQTAPIVQNTNELDEKTATDHRDIVATDEKATAGINGAMAAADKANQHALAAGQSADQANQSAQEAANRVDSLSGVVAGLDSYKELSDVSVTFATARYTLTSADKKELDGIATSLQTARGYLLQVTGGTDTVGSAGYNYKLSQERAYLSAKYNIPPHKFYLVGIGKDVQVASDKTAAGRAKNRRVEVKVLSNMSNVTATTGAAASPTASLR
jgi:OOP family OmpA-OmpF porin